MDSGRFGARDSLADTQPPRHEDTNKGPLHLRLAQRRATDLRFVILRVLESSW